MVIKLKPPKLFELYECMQRFHRLNARIIPPCIPHSEYYVLQSLLIMKKRDNARATVSDLADEIGISSPAVSKRLNSLEEKELIERIIDRSNRRNTYIEITEKGAKAVNTQERVLFAFMNRVIKIVGEEELDNTIRQLSKLVGVMETTASEMEAERINGKDIKIP